MKENPAQQWFDLRQEVMDRLKNENEALLKRLKDLEEQGVRSQSGEDLVPRESWEVVNQEKEELEQTVKQKEKRLLRLQQVRSKWRFSPSLFLFLKCYADLPGKEHRVPRSHRRNYGREARVLSQRSGANNVAIRLECFVRIPTDI